MIHEQSDYERRQSKLSAEIVIVLLALPLAFLVATPALALTACIAGLIVYVIVLLLARRGHITTGGLLLVCVALGTTLGMLAIPGQSLDILYFLAISLLAGSLVLLLAENEEQRLVIRELSVPVLPINERMLVMPLVGALDSSRLMMVQERALNAIQHEAARQLLLDITGVAVVDSQVALGLMSVVQAARLLGAEVVLVGVRPEIAQAGVGLGLDLRGMRAFGDLRTALATLTRAASAN